MHQDYFRRQNKLHTLLAVVSICFHFIINAEGQKRKDYILPDTINPIHYRIDLTLHGDADTTRQFEGVVTIRAVINRVPKGHNITLNAKNMEIIEVKILNDPSYRNQQYTTVTRLNTKLERLYITIKEGIEKKDVYSIAIKYKGRFQLDMTGFYLDNWKQENKVYWFAGTYLKPTHARKFFPCMDEPRYKSTFQIVITYPKGYNVISNTDKEEGTRSVSSDSSTTTFKTTPKMSTYHLALVVAKLQSYSVVLPQNIPYSIWFKKGLDSKVAYSAERATDMAIDYISTITAVSYNKAKLDKLDQVALPGFANEGGSQGWGIPIYNERYLLWDDNESPLRYKQAIYERVAGELAYTWFGNLITCTWWNDVWFQEGLVTFFAYYLVGVKEEWQYDAQFIANQRQIIMELDSHSALAPLVLPEDKVLTPTQIKQRFNDVTRIKGATMIHMMMNFMGREIFMNGIETLFKDEKGMFHVSTLKDFWASWSSIELSHVLPSGKGLEDVMNPWITREGFPVVHVARYYDKVVFTATKFGYTEDGTSENAWCIPIFYITSKNRHVNPTANWLCEDERLEINEDLSQEDSWILVNVEASAYIRVNYDYDLRKALTRALKTRHTQIGVLDRAQIVADSFNLARAGLISYEECFDTVSYIFVERAYHPWSVAFREFEFIGWRFATESELLFKLRAFTQFLLKPLYTHIHNTPGTSNHLDLLRNEKVMSFACRARNEDCLDEALHLFNGYMWDNRKIHQDSRYWIYCIGIKLSGLEVWERLQVILSDVNLPSEVDMMNRALGCTKSEELLKMLLLNAIERCHRHESPLIVMSVISESLEGIEVGLNFLIERFDDISACFEVDHLYSIFNVLADRIEKPFTAAKFKKFVQEIERTTKIKQVAEEALRKMEENMQWSKMMKEPIIKALMENYTLPQKAQHRSSATSTSISAFYIFAFVLVLLFVSLE